MQAKVGDRIVIKGHLLGEPDTEFESSRFEGGTANRRIWCAGATGRRA